MTYTPFSDTGNQGINPKKADKVDPYFAEM